MRTATDALLRTPIDRTRINMERSWEVLWWGIELMVTPDELCKLVNALGPDPETIRKRLAHAAKVSFKGGGED